VLPALFVSECGFLRRVWDIRKVGMDLGPGYAQGQSLVGISSKGL